MQSDIYPSVNMKAQLFNLINNLSNLSKYEAVYNLLADNYSKNIFIKLILYRFLGPIKVKLPLNTKEYWQQIKKYQSILPIKNSNSTAKSHIWNLSLLDLKPIGYQYKIINSPKAIHTIFGLEQYAYHKDKVNIKPQAGDYVIDGGACWGDASFYFASHVGNKGKVYSFEFVPSNIDIINKNLDLNPTIKHIIDIIPHPLSDKSDQTVHFTDFGPSTSLNSDEGPSVKTLNIDDFVIKYKVKKIDYIKMDIEGCELDALEGAIKTLKKFRPKLAISVYHKDQDIYEIPLYLNSFNLGYKFFLDHFTIHREETVLFATTKP